MKRAYTITSVDDSREGTKRSLRERMAFLPEIAAIEFVDGRNAAQLDSNLRGYEADGRLYDGELGVWFSQLNCRRYLAQSGLDALLVFEGEAEAVADIEEGLGGFLVAVPSGWDFLALHVAADQKQDYFYDRKFRADGSWYLASRATHSIESSPHHFGSAILVAAYPGYSAVAMLCSRAGAQKLLKLVGPKIGEPVDVFVVRERPQREPPRPCAQAVHPGLRDASRPRHARQGNPDPRGEGPPLTASAQRLAARRGGTRLSGGSLSVYCVSSALTARRSSSTSAPTEAFRPRPLSRKS